MLPPVSIEYLSAEPDPLPTLNKANLKTESYTGCSCKVCSGQYAIVSKLALCARRLS